MYTTKIKLPIELWQSAHDTLLQWLNQQPPITITWWVADRLSQRLHSKLRYPGMLPRGPLRLALPPDEALAIAAICQNNPYVYQLVFQQIDGQLTQRLTTPA